MRLFLFIPGLVGAAQWDLGTGFSSVTSGRYVPTLALGVQSESWGLLYRSLGARTPVYSQNAWAAGGHFVLMDEKFGWASASMGVGAGAVYIVRSFRGSPSADSVYNYDPVLGPLFVFRVKVGPVFVSWDIVLGLSSDSFFQNAVLNFQDVSHVSLGLSL